MGRVLFSVKANNDAHIALGVDAQHNGVHYEIVLGGWSNTGSVIRSGNQSPHLAVFAGSVLDSTEYVMFQISWDENMLTVDRSSDYDTSTLVEIMKFEDRGNPIFNYDIKYMMISTGWGATGEWKIIDYSSQ